MFERLPPNTLLRNRYRVIDLIGEGGMGAVYQAEDTRLEGRLCAIKEVILTAGTSLAYQEQAEAAFYQEASVLARLDQVNLPKVSDYFSVEGRDYLVMDYVPGENLRTLVEQARHREIPLTLDDIHDWARQLFDALEYLHRQDPPVLHRDIKPSNIRLTPEGVIKLVDFGLVKLLEPEDSNTVSILHGRATIQYAPLEQIGGDGAHTDHRADIYALGATLFHLLTNAPAPDAKNRYLAGSRQAPLSIRAVNPTVSSTVEQAILRAMSLHPTDRFATMVDFRQAFLASLPALSPKPDRANSLRYVAWRNRLMFVLIIVFLFIAVVLTFMVNNSTIAV